MLHSTERLIAFKKLNMQIPVLTICYTVANVSNPSGRIASGGGRSRAATPFACGAGTLWRGFAAGLRMTLWPSKQPSFPQGFNRRNLPATRPPLGGR